MATATLVNTDLDLGRKILIVLAQERIPVSVAFWAFLSQSDEWGLYIATVLVDLEGPKVAYDRILGALRNAGIDAQPLWNRIFLRSPKDPVLQLLEKETEIPNGSIQIMESQNIPHGRPSTYYITYTPYPTETLRVLNETIADRFVEDAYVYGKTWAVTGLDHLGELLSKVFHLNHGVVESTLADLSARKTASIANVRLRPQDLKRLRPA